MGNIYDAKGKAGNVIGEYDWGVIYKGTGITKEIIGSYSDGIIYLNQGHNKEIIGVCSNGTIWKGTGLLKEAIGSYSKGEVYYGVGIERRLAGNYYNDLGGIAAALLLFGICYCVESENQFCNPSPYSAEFEYNEWQGYTVSNYSIIEECIDGLPTPMFCMVVGIIMALIGRLVGAIIGIVIVIVSLGGIFFEYEGVCDVIVKGLPVVGLLLGVGIAWKIKKR